MSAKTTGTIHTAGENPTPSETSANYALTILTIIYILNFLDRNIISILIDPIKREYHLSDTVMGFISGFGFALFYSILAIPIARLADRGNRKLIVAVGFFIWSLLTALSGLAQSALQLTLARVGVGIGEAAGTPASQSLLSDFFPENRRSLALGIYSIGPYAGIFLGYFVGGWVNQYYGWHAAFFVAGLPGVLLALILYFTVKNPVRGSSERKRVDTRQQGVRSTLRFFSGQYAFVFMVIGFSLMGYSNFGLGAWTPAFLGRVRHMNTAQVGTYAGTLRGVFGILGTVLGGLMAEWAGRRNDRWKMLVPAIGSALGCPALLIFLFASRADVAFAGYAAVAFLTAMHLGPVLAVGLSVVKVGMRSFASAATYLCGNLIGLGMGPLAIGMLNDRLRPRYGVGAIRYSIATCAAASLLGGLSYWYASRYVQPDLARIAAEGSMGQGA